MMLCVQCLNSKVDTVLQAADHLDTPGICIEANGSMSEACVELHERPSRWNRMHSSR